MDFISFMNLFCLIYFVWQTIRSNLFVRIFLSLLNYKTWIKDKRNGESDSNPVCYFYSKDVLNFLDIDKATGKSKLEFDILNHLKIQSLGKNHCVDRKDRINNSDFIKILGLNSLKVIKFWEREGEVFYKLLYKKENYIASRNSLMFFIENHDRIVKETVLLGGGFYFATKFESFGECLNSFLSNGYNYKRLVIPENSIFWGYSGLGADKSMFLTMLNSLPLLLQIRGLNSESAVISILTILLDYFSSVVLKIYRTISNGLQTNIHYKISKYGFYERIKPTLRLIGDGWTPCDSVVGKPYFERGSVMWATLGKIPKNCDIVLDFEGSSKYDKKYIMSIFYLMIELFYKLSLQIKGLEKEICNLQDSGANSDCIKKKILERAKLKHRINGICFYNDSFAVFLNNKMEDVNINQSELESGDEELIKRYPMPDKRKKAIRIIKDFLKKRRNLFLNRSSGELMKATSKDFIFHFYFTRKVFEINKQNGVDLPNNKCQHFFDSEWVYFNCFEPKDLSKYLIPQIQGIVTGVRFKILSGFSKKRIHITPFADPNKYWVLLKCSDLLYISDETVLNGEEIDFGSAVKSIKEDIKLLCPVFISKRITDSIYDFIKINFGGLNEVREMQLDLLFKTRCCWVDNRLNLNILNSDLNSLSHKKFKNSHWKNITSEICCFMEKFGLRLYKTTKRKGYDGSKIKSIYLSKNGEDYRSLFDNLKGKESGHLIVKEVNSVDKSTCSYEESSGNSESISKVNTKSDNIGDKGDKKSKLSQMMADYFSGCKRSGVKVTKADIEAKKKEFEYIITQSSEADSSNEPVKPNDTIETRRVGIETTYLSKLKEGVEMSCLKEIELCQKLLNEKREKTVAGRRSEMRSLLIDKVHCGKAVKMGILTKREMDNASLKDREAKLIKEKEEFKAHIDRCVSELERRRINELINVVYYGSQVEKDRVLAPAITTIQQCLKDILGKPFRLNFNLNKKLDEESQGIGIFDKITDFFERVLKVSPDARKSKLISNSEKRILENDERINGLIAKIHEDAKSNIEDETDSIIDSINDEIKIEFKVNFEDYFKVSENLFSALTENIDELDIGDLLLEGSVNKLEKSMEKMSSSLNKRTNTKAKMKKGKGGGSNKKSLTTPEPRNRDQIFVDVVVDETPIPILTNSSEPIENTLLGTERTDTKTSHRKNVFKRILATQNKSKRKIEKEINDLLKRIKGVSSNNKSCKGIRLAIEEGKLKDNKEFESEFREIVFEWAKEGILKVEKKNSDLSINLFKRKREEDIFKIKSEIFLYMSASRYFIIKKIRNLLKKFKISAPFKLFKGILVKIMSLTMK